LISSYHNKRHLGPICEKFTQSQLWVMHHCHTIHTHCISFLDGNIGRHVILHNCKFESLHLGSISTWSNTLEIWKVMMVWCNCVEWIQHNINYLNYFQCMGA
jgi:hypothetical protein